MAPVLTAQTGSTLHSSRALTTSLYDGLRMSDRAATSELDPTTTRSPIDGEMAAQVSIRAGSFAALQSVERDVAINPHFALTGFGLVTGSRIPDADKRGNGVHGKCEDKPIDGPADQPNDEFEVHCHTVNRAHAFVDAPTLS